MLLLLAVGAALFIWFLVTFTHRPQYDKKKTQALLEKYNKLAPDQIVIPPAKVFLHAQERPTAPAYAVKKSNDSMELTVTTYQAFAQQIKNMAKSLSTLQLKKQTSYQQLGETVSIMARNVPEYVVALHACSACSIVSSGIYFTCAPNQVEYILNHAESKVLFIQQDLLGKLDTIADQLKHLKHIVVIGAKQDALPKFNGIKVYTFEEFITLGSGLDDSIVTRMIDEINADHVSTLIYTSGTTGPPKAAMLSYRNLSACSSRVITSIDHAITAKSILISYLPYAHVAEQVISYLCSCIVGCQVVFCEDARQVLDFLTLTRPHFFFGVPRVWEKMYAGIIAKLPKSGAKAVLLKAGQAVAMKRLAYRNCNEPVPMLIEMLYQVFFNLVFKKVHKLLGFERAVFFGTGSAPVSAEILEFFASIGIPISEVYGQTEGTALSTMAYNGGTKYGTVGLPFPKTEIKIDQNTSEILVKSVSVFMGYFKDVEATAKTVDSDGYLHSGDMGELDAHGFLKITGRIKDIIITSGGKNIAPKNIEMGLSLHPLIGQALAIGERKSFITALLGLDADNLVQWAKTNNVTFDAKGDVIAQLHKNEQLIKELQQAVQETNKQLSQVEQVKKFEVIPRALTIEQNEITPTQKLRRSAVEKNFAVLIDKMYSGAKE